MTPGTGKTFPPPSLAMRATDSIKWADWEKWAEKSLEEFAVEVIKLNDEARGKDAIGEVSGSNPTTALLFNEYLAGMPLFLSPTIPEGMALVNTKLNPKRREVLASAFEYGKCVMFVDLWHDLIAVAQGERNAD